MRVSRRTAESSFSSYSVISNTLFTLICVFSITSAAPLAVGQDIPSDEFKVDHTVTLAMTPDLPGSMEVRAAVGEVTAVRALLVIDGRLHRMSLATTATPGSFVGQFPSPWKRMEYRLQLATAKAGVRVSPNYTVEQSCRNSVLLTDKLQARGKVSAAREALLKEAILLDDDIRRLNYVERVVAALPAESAPISEEDEE